MPSGRVQRLLQVFYGTPDLVYNPLMRLEPTFMGATEAKVARRFRMDIVFLLLSVVLILLSLVLAGACEKLGRIVE